MAVALLGGFSGIGGGPFYGTGYYGGGGLGLIIIVLLVLLLMARIKEQRHSNIALVEWSDAGKRDVI